MNKILILTLILNIGFCSELPLNVSADGDCRQLRMFFSDVLECPAQVLETKTNSGTINGGTVNNSTMSGGTGNVVNNYGDTVNTVNFNCSII